MKKSIVLILLAVCIILSSCGDSKTFTKSDGTQFTAPCYGWMTRDEKIEGVQYDICGGNIVWSIVLGETIIAPLLLTGFELWEPVAYVEPKPVTIQKDSSE